VAQKVLHGSQIAGAQLAPRARRVAQGMIGDSRPLVRFSEISINLHADVVTAQPTCVCLRGDQTRHENHSLACLCLRGRAPQSFNNAIYGRSGRDQEIEKGVASIRAPAKIRLLVIEYNCYTNRAMASYSEETGDVRTGAHLTVNIVPLPLLPYDLIILFLSCKIANSVVAFSKESSMSIRAKNGYFFAAFLLLLPCAAFAADIQINGVCVLGTCPPPSGTSDALQLGQSIGPTAGSSSVIFADTDAYSVAWSYSASYTAGGTEIIVDPVVTYIGASPSVGSDVIAFDFFQNYYDASAGTWNGAYTETVPLALLGNVGAASTVSAELFYDGQGLGLVGPFGPGYHFGQNTETLTGLTAATLTAEYEFNFDFAAGTQTGASASSATPEPYEALPLGLALAGLVCSRLVVRRSSRYTR